MNNPLITEINIRHVVTTSSLVQAGFDLSEYLLACTLGEQSFISSILEKKYPKNNKILRDVDGQPIYVQVHRGLSIGQTMS